MTGDPRLTQAAYQALPGGPLDVDRALYDRIGETGSSEAASKQHRELIDSFVLPIRSGKAWKVRAGQVCRVVAVEGAQVGDLNIWNLHNPRERFWASRTRQLQRAHVSIYDRLWSCLPYLRPLCTITGDSLKDYGKGGNGKGGGVDDEGGRVHDLLGTRCDPYVNRMLTGQDFDYHCHSNLVRAVHPFGLVESDVHDVLNVFQCTGLNASDQYFMKTCPARRGDFFEFFAETDLLCALSTCPGGDLSKAMWGEGAQPAGAGDEDEDEDPTLECCRPLGVEVYDIRDKETVLQGWKQPEPFGNLYRGAHGWKAAAWGDKRA
ncbi:uncharacterized protein PFL1_01358 [Pseudozyma flocculosa PF-1]|uniref:DUF1989 domain-containing protein n=1 Tax=Pseudozyma flocculosa TaxID=84751 RepID=A0A5C3EY68_9BASI|nr:uncharacterized protein PFL1_01358 [Pseudozyma flocculosa PF-1]EPQ31170.1 hypothetical protein PFL1_01358 [Pseudozyma flocculosa PF-1]SPO36337.1 uncharacterized protein PSFLO_01808 [Pseudozyma flocculosa]